MILSIIAALDDRRGISRDSRIPWKLPTDLKRFRALTMGHSLIMGRKTFESIGKPLPGRVNIIVSRRTNYHPDGVTVVKSIQEALSVAERYGEHEVFCIGGGDLYAQFLPIADRLYLTHVYADCASDLFFPELDESWKIVSSEEYTADGENEYRTAFRIYIRP
jgi:dihydrofolate reductase